jgi:hypothetical protein
MALTPKSSNSKSTKDPIQDAINNLNENTKDPWDDSEETIGGSQETTDLIVPSDQEKPIKDLDIKDPIIPDEEEEEPKDPWDDSGETLDGAEDTEDSVTEDVVDPVDEETTEGEDQEDGSLQDATGEEETDNAEEAPDEEDGSRTTDDLFGDLLDDDDDSSEDEGETEEEEDFDIIEWYTNLLGDPNTEEAIAERKAYAFTAFDPNRGELQGTTYEGWARDQVIGWPFIRLVQENQISLDSLLPTELAVDYPYGYDGTRLFMKIPNTGGNTDLHQGFTDEEREELQDLENRGFFFDISNGQAGVGEYSMMWFEDPPEESTWDTFLNNPITNIIATLIPGGQLALTAVRAASGETLHGLDWLNLGLGALEAVGAIQPPTNVIDEAGNVIDVTEGVGLFGTTYEETLNILEIASNSNNPAGVLLRRFNLTGPALEAIGLDESFFYSNDIDILYTDFVDAVELAASAYASGQSLEDSFRWRSS